LKAFQVGAVSLEGDKAISNERDLSQTMHDLEVGGSCSLLSWGSDELGSVSFEFGNHRDDILEKG
jgi:hypothetical protein